MCPKLRHGLYYLRPSEIAEQFYCEYKVHLKRLHPSVRIELPALEHGEKGHEILSGAAAPIAPAEVEQAIDAGKALAMCEWNMEGQFQDVLIRGRPDFFAFEGKNAILLLDFKFSRAKTPFRNHTVQAEVYGLLAQSMGFSTEQLCLGIVLLSPAEPANALQLAPSAKDALLSTFHDGGTLDEIYALCKQEAKRLVTSGIEDKKIESRSWTAHLFRYDQRRIERDLGWALQYWLSQREPIPEKNYPKKCMACPLNQMRLCDKALQEPDSDFSRFKAAMSLPSSTGIVQPAPSGDRK